MTQSRKLYQTISVSMLSAIAYVLMMLDFPLPGFPVFLKIDLSEIPALLAAIVFGPVAGLLVEFFKNALHYGVQGSFTGVPLGQIANFTAGILFILPTAFIYRKLMSKKGLVVGASVGTVVMAIMMGVLNYFVLLPLYTILLNYDAMTNEAAFNLVLYGIVPFNVVKGAIVSILFMLVLPKLNPWLHKQTRTIGA
jgi:riboflavin transporter